MTKIGLFCTTGISTVLFSQKLKEEILIRNLDCELLAAPIVDIFSKKVDVDFIIISPQVRFNLKKVQSMYPGKPIFLIAEDDFKVLNAKGVVDQVEQEIYTKSKTDGRE